MNPDTDLDTRCDCTYNVRDEVEIITPECEIHAHLLDREVTV